MVKTPGEYPWSSFRARAGLINCDWLDEDPVLAALSPSLAERGRVYREFASIEVAASELDLIRTALQRNQLTGDQHFVDEVSRKFGIEVPSRGQGRPRKPEDAGRIRSRAPENETGARGARSRGK
jgi:putative transposase